MKTLLDEPPTGPVTRDGRARGAAMLAVDIGGQDTKALLVRGSERITVTDPAGAAAWPTAVCANDEGLLVGAAAQDRRRQTPDAFRAGNDSPPVVTVLLAAIRDRAAELAGEEVDRIVLTVPDGDAAEMRVEAARRAGFGIVETLPELSTVVDQGLVCDLGATGFSATVVNPASGHGPAGTVSTAKDASVGTAARGSGSVNSTSAVVRVPTDLVSLVVARLRETGAPSADTPLAQARLVIGLEAVARTLIGRLSTEDRAEEFLLPDAPPYRLSRKELWNLAEPALMELARRIQKLPTHRSSRGAPSRGVVVVGGLARLGFLVHGFGQVLDAAVLPAADPEFAVARGAAEWLAANRPLTSTAKPPRRSRRPLSWTLPTPTARLSRWLVEPGADFPAGAVLARIRLPGGTLWDLACPEPGRLVEVLAPADSTVASGQWLAVAAIRPR